MTAKSEKGWAIVTGASAGIGAALARELARRGRPVLAVARRTERLAALTEEAHTAGWAPIEGMAADVTEPAAADAVRDRARELGGAEWLVNNAGVALWGRFVEQDPAVLRNLMRLNDEALVMLTRAVLPDLVARRRGVVLNIASSAALQPTPFLALYGASKAFVLSFTEGISEELRGSGVTTTAFCPGPVTTEIFEVAGVAEGRKPPSHELTPEACARFAVEAGRVVAIPDLRTFLLTASSRLAPRSFVRRTSARVGLSYVGLTPMK